MQKEVNIQEKSRHTGTVAWRSQGARSKPDIVIWSPVLSGNYDLADGVMGRESGEHT